MYIIRLACVRSKTCNLQAVFFSLYLVHKKGVVVLGVPSRDRENWE